MPLQSSFPGLLLLLPLLLSSSPQTPAGNQEQIQVHARAAQRDLAEQKPELAIPELQKVIELDPNNLDARGNLGVLLFFRGDFKGAAPQLRAAVQLKPDLWKIQGLLGLAEARLQDATAARADLAAAFPHLTDDKFQLEVGRALIDNYSSTGELEKAAAIVSDLLTTRPTDASLLYLSYRLYADVADRSMLTLALADPNSAEMHQVMARELARHGDEAPAIANYREAIQINPQLPGLHAELANLLYRSSDEKQQAEAQSEFQAALTVNPRDEKALLALGVIAQKNGDVQTAYSDDSRAFALDPNDADACTELAKVLIQMNQKTKAQEILEHATQIDPTNYVAHYRLGTLYRQQGKTEEAKQQMADYQKYKQMKDKLQKILHDMRVTSGQNQPMDDLGTMQ